MKFSATVTLQYDTIFSSFSPADYLKGLDWMKANHLDGAELCISNYNNLNWIREDLAALLCPQDRLVDLRTYL